MFCKLYWLSYQLYIETTAADVCQYSKQKHWNVHYRCSINEGNEKLLSVFALSETVPVCILTLIEYYLCFIRMYFDLPEYR